MEERNYSGYFCSKCKYIPLIKIISKDNNIKVFSSCKCHKQYENIESFLKNKSKKDIIDKSKINKESPYNYHNKISFDKSTLDSIIQKFNEEKIKIIEEGIKIKNQLIELFQKKIEEVNKMYLKYSEKNNKIFLIIEQLIRSYESLKENKSNILNILNNCKFQKIYRINYFENYINLESLTKSIENYFCNEYIISNLDSSDCLENLYSYYSENKIKEFFELNNEICAFISECDNKISLLDFNQFQKEFYTFKAYNQNIAYIIKSSMNNVISIGDANIIKIWPNIERSMITEERNKNISNEDDKKNNYKDKEISFNLNPIIISNLEIKESVIKMINLKENRFLIALKSNIFLLFKYSINDIELIQKYENKNNLSNFDDIFYIQKENIEMICLNDKSNIYYFELENFKYIKSNPLKYMNKNSLIQINPKEILIGDGYNFQIITLDFFNIKLKLRNEDKKLYLLNLNDGTFIQSTGDKLKRYFIKTMEELPLLEQNDYEDNYDDSLDYNNYNDDIIYYLYRLNDGKIITFHNNGRFTVGYLKYN